MALACKPDRSLNVGVVDGEYYPIINTNTWTLPTTMATNATLSLELQYASYGSIQAINVYQTLNRTISGVVNRDTSLVFTTPYRPAFSATKQCDTLVYTYTAPAVTRPAGTTAVNSALIFEVVNTNGLIKRRVTASTFTR